MQCPKCQYENAEGALLCNLCGLVLRRVAAKVAPAPAAPPPSAERRFTFAELAERQVERARAFGVALDFSPASLFALDLLFEQAGGARSPEQDFRPTEAQNNVIVEAGAYLGEVLRRAFDGAWIHAPNGAIPDTQVGFGAHAVYPLRRAFFHLKNGGSSAFGPLYDDCCRALGISHAATDTKAAWAKQAESFRRCGRDDLAEPFARRALALGPNDAPPADPTRHRREARAKLKRGDLEGALHAFTLHLEGTPGERDSTIDRAMVLADLQRFDEALRGLDEVLAKDPTDLEALDGKSMTLGKAGRVDLALLVSDEILRLHPERTPTWRQRSRFLARRGDQAGALEALKHATSIAPSEPESWLLRGSLERWLGRAADAEQSLGRALALAAEGTEVHVAAERERRALRG